MTTIQPNTETNIENICGIYDVETNTASLNSGKVLRFRSKTFQEIDNRDVLFDRLNKWTRQKNFISENEVIAVMN